MSENKTRRGPMGRGPMGGGPMGGMVEKPKEFKKTWLRLIRYSKRYAPAVITALALAAIGTVMQIIGQTGSRIWLI